MNKAIDFPLFQGKRKTDGQWVEGDFVRDWQGMGAAIKTGDFFTLVIPETVRPFTHIKVKPKAVDESTFDKWMSALPFKIGDIAYFAVKDSHNAAVIEQIVIDYKGLHYEWTMYETSPELTEVWDTGSFTLSDIGKTVFRTFKEAYMELTK